MWEAVLTHPDRSVAEVVQWLSPMNECEGYWTTASHGRGRGAAPDPALRLPKGFTEECAATLSPRYGCGKHRGKSRSLACDGSLHRRA